jgi:hypothetical protein
MSDPVVFTDAELRAIEALAEYALTPGTRCPLCHRRMNRTKTREAPETREMRLRGPSEVVEAVEEGFDNLQEYAGVDPYGFPRIRLMEYLLALGAQHREELKAHFEEEK